MTASFETGIDACVVWTNGRAYFFRGDRYLRFDIASDRVDQDPRLTREFWGGWPQSWWEGSIQGAVAHGAQWIYFFRGSEYLRYDMIADRVSDGYPRPIAGNWPGWPAAWADGVDGCIGWSNGLVYFFKGANYIRYDMNTDRVTKAPSPISPAWGNWPGDWNSGINGGGVWPNGKAYLFRGPEYIRYDVAADAADANYRGTIKDNWNKWPGYDLTEGTYTIKSTHGKYLSRDSTNRSIIGNRDSASTWERFKLKRSGSGWTIQDHLEWYWERSVVRPHIEWIPGVISDLPHSLGFDVRETKIIVITEGSFGSTTWQIQRVSPNHYAFKVICGLSPETYVTAEPAGTMGIGMTVRGDWETFTLTRVGD